MKDFRKLDMWKESHKFTLSIYSLSEKFPKSEQYGLVSQIKRSTHSIASNIAEGYGKDSKAEMFRFFQIAAGSIAETENHLIFAKSLNYLEEKEYNDLLKEITRIKKMLTVYMYKVKKSLKVA